MHIIDVPEAEMVNKIKKIVVLVGGSSQNGKDTFIPMLREAMGGIPVMRISVVDPIYKAMVENLGISIEPRDDRKRKFMADLVDLWTDYCDGPVEYVKRMVEIEADALARWANFDRVVFCVIARDPRDIKKLSEYYNGRFMSIIIRGNAQHVPDNHADRGVDGYAYDVIVNNTGDLEDLRKQAGDLADRIFSQWPEFRLTSAA